MVHEVLALSQKAFPDAKEVYAPLFHSMDGTRHGVKIVLGGERETRILKDQFFLGLTGIQKAKHTLRRRVRRLLRNTGVIVLENHTLASPETPLLPPSKNSFNAISGRDHCSGHWTPQFWHFDAGFPKAAAILHRNPEKDPPRLHPTCFSTVEYIHKRIIDVLPEFAAHVQG